jgi:hypothetical protein
MRSPKEWGFTDFIQAENFGTMKDYEGMLVPQESFNARHCHLSKQVTRKKGIQRN